jgi:hypothetical protein
MIKSAIDDIGSNFIAGEKEKNLQSHQIMANSVAEKTQPKLQSNGEKNIMTTSL